jgi:hypothetical protein
MKLLLEDRARSVCPQRRTAAGDFRQFLSTIALKAFMRIYLRNLEPSDWLLATQR